MFFDKPPSSRLLLTSLYTNASSGDTLQNSHSQRKSFVLCVYMIKQKEGSDQFGCLAIGKALDSIC